VSFVAVSERSLAQWCVFGECHFMLLQLHEYRLQWHVSWGECIWPSHVIEIGFSGLLYSKLKVLKRGRLFLEEEEEARGNQYFSIIFEWHTSLDCVATLLQ